MHSRNISLASYIVRNSSVSRRIARAPTIATRSAASILSHDLSIKATVPATTTSSDNIVQQPIRAIRAPLRNSKRFYFTSTTKQQAPFFTLKQQLHNQHYQHVQQRATFSSIPREQDENSSSNNNNTVATTTIMRITTPQGAFLVSILGAGLALLALQDSLALAEEQQQEQQPQEEEEGGQPVVVAGEYKEGLPEYSREEVAKHKTKETGIWVVYKDGIYDITDFIESHPGGNKILLAAGSAIDPFWSIYAAHHTPETYELIESFRIGNLSVADREARQKAQQGKDVNDPYANEPERLPVLIPRSDRPFNAEPPAQLLTESYITPNEFFFVRNHLPVPKIDPNEYVLEITGEGIDGGVVRLTLDDLQTKFPQHTITATIQCAGNRRHDMSQVKPVRGLDWNVGAISNAQWTGVRLRDVLAYAGLTEDKADAIGVEHIQFEGADRDTVGTCYGASIPVEKALNPHGDVLLAFKMNGVDIPRDHGYPVRAVVPGVVGARNVKWLRRVVASKEESPSFWQRNDYKGFNPSTDFNNVDYSKSVAIQELPVTSAITEYGIVEGSKQATIEEPAPVVHAKGYAWSGGGRNIIRVDVSADGGQTWHVAELKKPEKQRTGHGWSWTFWEANIPLPNEILERAQEQQQKEVELVCKAVDESYNVQPETFPPIYNIRGNLNTAWHRVKVPVPPKTAAAAEDNRRG